MMLMMIYARATPYRRPVVVGTPAQDSHGHDGLISLFNSSAKAKISTSCHDAEENIAL